MTHIPRAVALQYDEVKAPTLTAKGDAAIAEEIMRLAEAHGVPLYENAELVEVLAKLELGEEIPELLYRVVAEIIAFAYHLRGMAPGDKGDGQNNNEGDRP